MRTMSVARVLAASLVVGLASLTTATGALASCIQQTLAEQAERADAIVYGRVTGMEGPPGIPARFVFVDVERVLKGSVVAQIGVAIGPGAEGGVSSAPTATSVDYPMDRGTDHTLYLKQTAPAGYETNACSGSHPGPPTADEERLFGAGRAPDRAPTGLDSATDADRAIAAAVTLIALAGGAGAIVFAMRSRRAAAI
jgi:hypothetical protein